LAERLCVTPAFESSFSHKRSADGLHFGEIRLQAPVLTVSGTASGVSIAPTTVNLTVAAPKGKEKEKEFKERKEKEFEGDKGGKDNRDRLEEERRWFRDPSPLES
jgi:hypothetical protein